MRIADLRKAAKYIDRNNIINQYIKGDYCMIISFKKKMQNPSVQFIF